MLAPERPHQIISSQPNQPRYILSLRPQVDASARQRLGHRRVEQEGENMEVEGDVVHDQQGCCRCIAESSSVGDEGRAQDTGVLAHTAVADEGDGGGEEGQGGERGAEAELRVRCRELRSGFGSGGMREDDACGE